MVQSPARSSSLLLHSLNILTISETFSYSAPFDGGCEAHGLFPVLGVKDQTNGRSSSWFGPLGSETCSFVQQV